MKKEDDTSSFSKWLIHNSQNTNIFQGEDLWRRQCDRSVSFVHLYLHCTFQTHRIKMLRRFKNQLDFMNYCDCTKHFPRSLSGCKLGSFGTKTSNFWGFLIRKLRFVKQKSWKQNFWNGKYLFQHWKMVAKRERLFLNSENKRTDKWCIKFKENYFFFRRKVLCHYWRHYGYQVVGQIIVAFNSCVTLLTLLKKVSIYVKRW